MSRSNRKKDKHTNYHKNSDKLWNMINHILLTEKQNNTMGCFIVPFRKVMDGIQVLLLIVTWIFKV